MAITILGLGPGDATQLTREAWSVLQASSEIYLRTRHHPTAQELPAHLVLHSFDDFYQQAEDLPQVYQNIAEEVVRLGQRPEGVVYAVPGHPWVGESTVTRIVQLAEQVNLPVQVVNGIDFIAPTLARLGVDALNGLQVADAAELAVQYHPPLNPDVPAIIGQLYSRDVASGVKLTLMNQYPDDHPVMLAHAIGTPQERLEQVPLYELDQRDDIDHLMALYVPPLPQPSALETFQDTIAHLRAPDGCPWDREQTHLSLRRNLLEEAYEVLAALDAQDASALREEMGDLLLQIVLHTQIAVESGEFSMADVIAEIDAKIKRRHPHVFGHARVTGVGDVIANWETIKRSERARGGNGDKSALDGVPACLPALAQAEAYSERASRVGFDWPDVEGVLDKVAEEVREIHQAAEADRADEFGDLLFALVNVARWMRIDPEAALRSANARFVRRFRSVEAQARAQSRDLQGMDLADLDELWESAKRANG